MGVFPRLSGQTADYIQGRLVSYKNRETIGNMSSTMWAQAGMLSDNEIETLSKFIEETME
jgi:cytochrome c553